MLSPKKIYTSIYLEDNITSHVSTALPCTIRITNQAPQNHEMNLEILGVSLFGLAPHSTLATHIGWVFHRHLDFLIFRWTLILCSPRLVAVYFSISTFLHLDYKSQPTFRFPTHYHTQLLQLLNTVWSQHLNITIGNEWSYLGLVRLIMRFWYELVIHQKDIWRV